MNEREDGISITLGEAPALRRVLLAVVGLTPQVVTETVYALSREGQDRLPHELHVLTTAEGAERVRLALLSEQPGWFRRLIDDYGLDPIRFDANQVHMLRDVDGSVLSDIRDKAQNTLAADQIAELVRHFTSDQRCQLHVSLAGGRKTLGFFAGYALSLWGRSCDRLSHVLVNEPYESSWEFFYPTPYERIISTRDGKLADCAKAEVTLADLLFVRLRHGLTESLLTQSANFAEAVRSAQQELDPPRLTLELARRRVRAGHVEFALAPAELATLAWFALRARQGLPGLECPPDGAPSTEHAADYLSMYRRIRSFIEDDGRAVARYRHGMSKADFEERKSKLKAALRRVLGTAASPYVVTGQGRRPMRYRLELPRDAIEFVDDRSESSQGPSR